MVVKIPDYEVQQLNEYKIKYVENMILTTRLGILVLIPEGFQGLF